MNSTVDTNMLVIIMNLSGWVIVFYLTKNYFDEMKAIKQQNITIENDQNIITIEQKLQAQRLTGLEKSMEGIHSNITDIKNMLSKNSDLLIQELKDRLKGKE